MKVGSLVRQIKTVKADGHSFLEEDLGIGLIVESWENQFTFPDVPDHDPEDRVVLFGKIYKILKTSELELLNT